MDAHFTIYFIVIYEVLHNQQLHCVTYSTLLHVWLQLYCILISSKSTTVLYVFAHMHLYFNFEYACNCIVFVSARAIVFQFRVRVQLYFICDYKYICILISCMSTHFPIYVIIISAVLHQQQLHYLPHANIFSLWLQAQLYFNLAYDYNCMLFVITCAFVF